MTTTPPQPAELADLVRSRREELGLSQRALAAAAGVGHSSIQSLENPRRDHRRDGRPRAATIRQVAAALKLDAPTERVLLELAGHDPDLHANRPEPGRPTVSDGELKAAFDRLRPEDRPAVLHVISALPGREAVA